MSVGIALATGLVAVLAPAGGAEADNRSAEAYHIYAGSTHAHTQFTWSHGEQWASAEKGEGGGKMRITPEGAQSPAESAKLKQDWEKNNQGPPAGHYARAKTAHYDFYTTTDHSQEAGFYPTSPTNATWLAARQQAAAATGPDFVALAGFEFSENNGPGGKGHINVINSAEYLNALTPGVDLPYFYRWLQRAAANGDGPVVASFNHPGAQQYNDWADRDAGVTEVITMLEMINSNKSIKYDAFVRALDHGWKVSPVCGNDNHGFWGITRHMSRTFVLATARTKVAILDAMKHRRTYASLDGNIECRYTANGAIMGSTLDRSETIEFKISIRDPDVNDPKDRITKIDLVTDGGAVAQTFEPTPAHAVTWTPTIRPAGNTYYFVRVWSAGGADLAEANANAPVAWLAPIWTGR